MERKPKKWQENADLGGGLTVTPPGTFQTKKGLINIAANEEKQWQSLIKHLGCQCLPNDDRFSTRDSRKKNRKQLNNELEKFLKKKSAVKWEEELIEIGVPSGTVMSIPEILAHPQIKHRELLAKFENLQITIKILGSIYLIFLAYKISFAETKSEKKVRKPVTFINTFFFQFVNPKSIIAGSTAVSLFIDIQSDYLRDSIIFVIVMFVAAVGSQSAWCLMGTYLRKFATSEKFVKNFNYTMSFLLIVCVIMFYV